MNEKYENMYIWLNKTRTKLEPLKQLFGSHLGLFNHACAHAVKQCPHTVIVISIAEFNKIISISGLWFDSECFVLLNNLKIYVAIFHIYSVMLLQRSNFCPNPHNGHPISRPWYGVFSLWRHQMENIFRVTGPLCGEFTGPGEFPTQRPVTRSFDVFFDLCLNKRLSKQSWGWWFETQSWSLWRHSNVWVQSLTNVLLLLYLW